MRDHAKELYEVMEVLDDLDLLNTSEKARAAAREFERLRAQNVGGDVGQELARLSEAATPGEWHLDMFPVYDEDSGAELAPMCEGICIHTEDHEAESVLSCSEPEASFIVALVNAYRSGRLIAAPAPEKCGVECGAN